MSNFVILIAVDFHVRVMLLKHQQGNNQKRNFPKVASIGGRRALIYIRHKTSRTPGAFMPEEIIDCGVGLQSQSFDLHPATEQYVSPGNPLCMLQLAGMQTIDARAWAYGSADRLFPVENMKTTIWLSHDTRSTMVRPHMPHGPPISGYLLKHEDLSARFEL